MKRKSIVEKLFKIEKQVPLIPKQSCKLSQTSREMMKMLPGDSFLWHENNAIYRQAEAAGIKITTRKINGQGYRVWRVK